MNAVTIHDLSELAGGRVLAFDLIDILRLAEPDVLASSWRCWHVECSGGLAEQLHRASDAGNPVEGAQMLRLAAGVVQIANGDFEAFRPAGARPWLVIRAVDSSLFVVITDDVGLMTRLRRRFRDVRDSPEGAAYVA